LLFAFGWWTIVLEFNALYGWKVGDEMIGKIWDGFRVVVGLCVLALAFALWKWCGLNGWWSLIGGSLGVTATVVPLMYAECYLAKRARRQYKADPFIVRFDLIVKRLKVSREPATVDERIKLIIVHQIYPARYYYQLGTPDNIYDLTFRFLCDKWCESGQDPAALEVLLESYQIALNDSPALCCGALKSYFLGAQGNLV
jgi:hypothetical protein